MRRRGEEVESGGGEVRRGRAVVRRQRVVAMVMDPNGKRIRVGCCSGCSYKARRGRGECRSGRPAWGF